jgi:hypothetical protein
MLMGEMEKILEMLEPGATLRANLRERCMWKLFDQLIGRKQSEYLVEETYLSYEGGGRSLEERVISFIRAIAKGEFGATTPGKAAALEGIIREIKTPEVPSDKFWKILGLMRTDRERNLSRKWDGEIPEKFSRMPDDKVVFCDGVVSLPAPGTLYVVGDTHGDAETVKKLVECSRKSLQQQDDVYVVFLGDYVNNGLNSIDTLISVLELKKDFPESVVLLSGNHEFRETYFTAIREYFETHWKNAASHPSKSPPSHYDHIRLELAKKFGVERGEAVYALFAEWGRSLPYIAYSAKGVMMSHSIGLPPEYVGKGSTRTLSLRVLAQAKRGADERAFEQLGYEAWRREAHNLHAYMVNGRSVDPGTLERFRALGARVFAIGHNHYRSGDIHKKGEMVAADIGQEGILVTLCSSVPDSPDAGHYIGHQFGCRRNCEQREGRSGLARACILKFEEDVVDSIVEGNLIDVSEL